MKIFLDDISETICIIKSGDEILRNDFIERYMSFIVNTISKTTNRYIDVNNSEELSVGLMAFNEAIDKYDESKGSFINFSKIVIRSRVLDFLKKEKRNENISLEDGPMKEEKYEEDFTGIEVKDEIEKFIQKLKSFGITLKELADKAPKHCDTKEKIVLVGKRIYNNPILYSEFQRKRKIPIRAAARYCGISEKVIKNNKIHIIAYILVLEGDGDALKRYFGIKGGVSNG